MIRSLLFAAAFAASPVAAEPSVTKVSPELIGSVLSDLGVQYELKKLDNGDPRLVINTGALAAKGMQIDFWDCTPSNECEDMTIRAWFAAKPPATLANVNAWNRDKRFTRAYIDSDNEANLEMDINATGGVGMGNIQIMMKSYFQWVSEFPREVTTIN